MQVHEGTFDAGHLRVAIVAARFNETITARLVDGAADCLRRHGVREDEITLVWVPGAFELPIAAHRIASSGEVDAVVAVGAVIRGETAHFDYVSSQAMRGIGDAALATGIPITCAILTTETVDQAEARAGGKYGNKGFEAALAAMEMASLLAALPKSSSSLD